MTDFLLLPHLRVLAVHDQGSEYTVEAEGKVLPSACPECRMGRLHGHGTQPQSYRDTPSHGKAVQITVHRRRFRCQACGKTCFDAIPDLDPKRLATRRLVAYVRSRCLRETFAALAREVGLDEKTIRHIFDDYIAECEARVHFETPRYLGIDEIKIIGAYRAMITNVERRTLFDMRESRAKADLLPYFRRLRGREAVRWVTMDMYHVYRQVIRTTLPEARIIVDKFHIQRMANEVLERLRKRVRKTLPQRQRLKLKDERFLLLKRQHDLKPSEVDRLFAWFREFPLLAEAHASKEGFLSIWDQRTRSDAEKAYDLWTGNLASELISDFKPLTTAVTNWRDEIFAYFEQPITNAYTEAVNGLVKTMNRMGRGYSFEVIRARMLYDEKARKDGTQVVTERKPEEDDGKPSMGFVTDVRGQPRREKTVQRVVEYGPYIPTLTKLLEEGYFD